MAKQLAIDLGTANTLLFEQGRGIVIREPTVIVVEKQSRSTVTWGRRAYGMLGRTPNSMLACRPLQNGAVVDGELTAKFLSALFREVGSISFFSRPSVLIGVPRGSTEVERRAIEDAAYDAGARSISLIDEPTAAALGAGMKITGARGNMIVDIGSGITEVTLLSLSGIVRTRALRSGGDALDAAIVRYLRERHDLLIGDGLAEGLKIRYGSLHPLADRGSVEISGRSLKTHLPSTLRIGTAQLREAMIPWFDSLVALLQQTLKETPPELAADLYDRGIVLCGGGSLLHGLPGRLEEQTGLRTVIAPHPLECVCLGMGKALSGR